MRERMQASVALEIALLVSLASTDKDICDDASLCLAELCQEARLVDLEDGVEPSHISFACNVKVYEDLCQEDTKYVGRKAQQKKIRKHLRMLPNHTPGNMAAWEEAWNRWKKLTQLIRRLSDDIINEELQDQISFTSTSTSSSSNKKAVGPNVLSPKPGRNEKTKTMFRNSKMSDLLEEKSMEWQNYTGFLAALGGCCLANRFDANLEEGSDTRNSDSTRLVDRFIGDMVEMLVSDNLYIREGVKDTLGNDLTPALYAMLFRHLEFRMAQCFDSNGGTIRSPQNKLFVEQSVLVLRLILERLVEQNDHLLSVDFNTLISNFADFLNQLPNTQVTMRIKIQMCILVEIAIQKREHIVIRDEVNLRNRILQITVEWSSDFVMVIFFFLEYIRPYTKYICFLLKDGRRSTSGEIPKRFRSRLS